MNQNVSLENELENLIRAVEEIVQIIIRINQKKHTIANSDNQGEKKRLEKEIQEDLNELNDKQDDLNMVKNSLKTPGILNEQQVVNVESKDQVSEVEHRNENIPSPIATAIPVIEEKAASETKLSPLQEKEKDAIAKEMESIAQDANSVMSEINVDAVKYPSLLNSIGNQILTFDQRLETLKNQMEEFFENVPLNLKMGVALFFVNRLENVSSKIEALKEKFAEIVHLDQAKESPVEQTTIINEYVGGQDQIGKESSIQPLDDKSKNNSEIIETIEQVPDPIGISLPSSDDFVLKEESKMSTPSFQTARQMISTQEGKEFFTIKTLIGGIQSSVNALQHEIALKEQAFIFDEKSKNNDQIYPGGLQGGNESALAHQNRAESLENQWDQER